MTDPKQEHVEAIADLIEEWLVRMHGIIATSCNHHTEAEEFLNSDDPAVHAAMLDALTRHGVLTEQTAAWHGGVQSWLTTERRDISHDEAIARLRKRLTDEVAP